jgi:23S rRNA (cytosine1962-C5)-methyltransferase
MMSEPEAGLDAGAGAEVGTASIAPLLSQWDRRFDGQADGPFDSCRVFHGRGGCFPGLEWCCVDVHWPAVLVTFFLKPPADFSAALQEALLPRMERLSLSVLLFQSRYLPGAPYKIGTGVLPETLTAYRNKLRFHLSLQQQNPGFFLDMEPGRQWLESQCAGKRVLNLFAYTCAFSVVAQAAGASEVVNVDMSSRSLSVGRENHRLNGQSTGNIQFLAENILKSWSRIRRRGPFDIILVDPPSFQKGSFVATRDYAKVLRRLGELAAPEARILVCLNAPELDEDYVRQLVADNSPASVFEQRLDGHPDFPDVDPGRKLKLLVYRIAETDFFSSGSVSLSRLAPLRGKW